MSTITTLGASDSGSTSRGVINTNFDNLNTDKVESLSDLGLTADATELNHVDGVTSAIQTQLDGKAASLGADDNYVTDAEKVVIGNTSGTNTGDEPAADTTTSGVVELATDAETLAASSDSVVMTPGNLGANIIRVYKSADETVNDSAVLQDDDHLLFAVGANEVWHYEVGLNAVSGLTPDFKFKWVVPDSTTMKWSTFAITSTGTAELDETSELVVGGTSANRWILFQGTISVSSTAGNIQLQWAQNTQDASDTKVLKGSYIIAHRLA